MTFHVVIQRLAILDLDDAFVRASRQAPATAARWLDRFEAALQRLDTNPQSWPRAREHGKLDVELREMLFGRRPNVYHVIFMIDGESVHILRIRRAQRRELTREQIDEASQQDEP